MVRPVSLFETGGSQYEIYVGYAISLPQAIGLKTFII